MNFARHIVAKTSNDSVVVMDLSENAVIREYTAFDEFLREKYSLKLETRLSKIRQVIRFGEIVRLNQIDLQLLTLADLIRIRDIELALVLKDKSYRNNVCKAKNTVNGKLTSICDYLRFCKATNILPNLQVEIPDKSQYESKSRRRVRGSSSNLFYKDREKGNKHGSGFLLSTEELATVMAAAMESSCNHYAAYRNWLILRVAHKTGLRRGSLLSLKASRFDRNSLKKELARTKRDGISVIPSAQKFGYKNAFFLSSALCFQIADYCENFRTPLIQVKNGGHDYSDDALFLSSKDALPLTDTSTSRICRNLMVKVGAPKGLALHILRKMFAGEVLDEEEEHRVSHGLDTSTASLMRAVSTSLGQKDKSSAYQYVSEQEARKGQNRRAEKENESSRFF